MGTLTWFATGEWHGGRTLCLIMRYLDMFVFAANSNVLVCVAIDRYVLGLFIINYTYLFISVYSSYHYSVLHALRSVYNEM
jgi:hypothetical protein